MKFNDLIKSSAIQAQEDRRSQERVAGVNIQYTVTQNYKYTAN